jgi:hypothetical protein
MNSLEAWCREAEVIYTRACYGRKYTAAQAVADARELERQSPEGASYLRYLLERRKRFASAPVEGIWPY